MLLTTLSRNALRTSAISTAIVFLVAVLASAVRLLPWFVAKDVPWQVALPFARALLAVAAEVAAIVGPPVGFALAAAESVRRGEARALACLGLSPWRIALRAAPAVLVAAAFAAFSGVHAPSRSESPGTLVGELIEQGRQGCEVGRPQTLTVPVAKVTWLCFADGRAVVSGPMPGARGGIFLARTLKPDAVLSRFSAEDLTLALRGPEVVPLIRVQAGAGQIRGLSPWGRPGLLSGFERGALLGGLTTLAIVSVLLLVLGANMENQLAALLAGALPAAAGFWLLRLLDASHAARWEYVLALAAPGAAVGAMTLARQLWTRFSASTLLSDVSDDSSTSA